LEAAVEQDGNIQTLGDLVQQQCAVAEQPGGGSPDDAQARNLRQAIDNLHREPVAEVIVIAVVTEIREWKNRERLCTCSLSSGFYLPDEAVATMRNGFNVAWILRGVTKDMPQAIDRNIQAVLEIDECAGGPNAFHEFFAADDLTGAFEQSHQYVEWLILNPEPYAMLSQLFFPSIQFEGAESNHPGEY
jgi:hypothetical protein